MILLDIVLSLVALIVGSVPGSLFWSFHLGFGWLRKELADDNALYAFWLFYFKPHGGVRAMMGDDVAAVDPGGKLPLSFSSLTIIRVELETFIKMRRLCAIAIGVLGAMCLLVSAYTSVAVMICFIVAVVMSALLRNRHYPVQSLATIFRAVRRWMDADRQSLAEGPRCIRGVVLVLDANEPRDGLLPLTDAA